MASMLATWQWVHGFHRPSRKEAQIIEDIMVRLSKIAVLNSYEYVDTTAVSEILGVEFDSTSYDSYVGGTGIVQIHAASGAHGVVS
jgi:hypothetical protein